MYKHGSYPLPNDAVEQNRDDMKHAIMMELTVCRRDMPQSRLATDRDSKEGRLCYAPLTDNVEKIIDIGTGTGEFSESNSRCIAD